MSILVIDINCPHCNRPIITDITDYGFVHCSYEDCRAASYLYEDWYIFRKILADGRCSCGKFFQVIIDSTTKAIVKIIEIEPMERKEEMYVVKV